MSSLHKNLELGREKLGHGDYTGALTYADAALALDAASFDALQIRSRALFLLGRDAEALQTLRLAYTILHAAPAEQDEEEDVDDCFAAALFPKEPPLADEPPIGTDALETLLALRERNQLDAQLLGLLAELAEDAGRFEIAREAFEELVEMQPTQLDAWEGLVHVLSHEDLDAALEAISHAQALHPTHPLFYEFLGFIRYRRRQFQQAILAYREAIEYGADHLDNYQSLVQCYFALGETATALTLTRELVERGANDVELHRFAIEIALHCGDPALAMQEAHQLVRLQPSHAETYCYKARVELAQGDWPATERTLRLGFHKAVDGAFALFELVEVLISDDELDQAMQVAELAYLLAPDHPESSASRGKVYQEIGAFQDAFTAFREAAAQAPQDDTYQTWMGVVLNSLGDYHAAIRQFNHVLARHPSDVWTLSNRGLSYLALSVPERALIDFTRGLEIDPEEATLFFWRACARVQMHEIEEALHDLSRAVDLSDEMLSWLEQEPMLDCLRRDVRFRALLHRAGNER